ncbi:lactate racemase domain-containing protein [Streptomonospora sediminis]
MRSVPLNRIRRSLPAAALADPGDRAREQVGALLDGSGVPAGARVAFTAGSRGIGGITEVLRGAVQAAADRGCRPLLFSTMGSHGGGTAEGQRDVLTSLGITEEAVGAPVSCSAEVVQLGETGDPLPGLPVHFAAEAAAADAIIAVNRVKPHTSFHGPHESGLLKMLSVGAGRASGAAMVHRLGWARMVEAIGAISSAVLQRAPVIGGLALVQDPYEGLAAVEGLPADGIAAGEARLLETARELLPRLPVDDLDALVVREMGKAYSGCGMDTNVIGRLRLEGMAEPARPHIRCLAVLDLAADSHGNATGVGLADFTTERLAGAIDRQSTYLNCLTSGGPQRAAVPMTYPDDAAVLEAMGTMLRPEREADVRLAVIDNTLALDRMWVSDPVLAEAAATEEIEVEERIERPRFDGAGRLLP